MSAEDIQDGEVSLRVFLGAESTKEKGFYHVDLLHTLAIKGLREPHKITFLHPSGVVSYAILKPPHAATPHSLRSDERLPVMLFLHGSGLDVDSHAARHALDEAGDLHAWALQPTGGTSWCGDDWRKFSWPKAASMVG